MTVATLSRLYPCSVNQTQAGTGSSPHSQGDRQPLIVIDPSVENYQLLVDAATAEVVVLNATDGIAQLSQILAARQVSSLQILCHGQPGLLQLGGSAIDVGQLVAAQAQLQTWGRSLSEISIYACHLAAGEVGRQWVDQLAELTGVAIAASDHLTGAGGDWSLEYATGEMEERLAIAETALANYPSTLGSYIVSSEEALRDAINQASNTPEDDNITVTGSFALSSALPTISSNITFEGNNSATISGSGAYRIFTVDGGNVRFSGLTLTDGLAKGENGTGTDNSGKPGLGGGIYIKRGNVLLTNVVIKNSRAVGGNGGSSSGIGGNGGAGNGGAIYIESGTLRLAIATFTGNSAEAGKPGTGAFGSANGVAGTGKGGAIYVNPSAQVTAEVNPVFSNNNADSATGTAGTDNDNIFGAITSVPAPQIVRIDRAQAPLTASDSLSYTVTFDQSVTGVDATDFVVRSLRGDTGNSLVGQAITSVTGSGTTYTVEVNTGTGNGDLRLDLIDNDSIQSAASVPLGSTGTGNGNKPGQVYTVNKTPPTAAIALEGINPTAADVVTYRVTFTQNVTGVDVADFAIANPDDTILGASVTAVKKQRDDVYDIEVNTGTGNGRLGLNLVDDDSIKNTLGLALGTTSTTGTPIAGNGSVTGSIFNIDKTPPSVVSILPASASSTKADTATYTVLFSKNVTGVDVADFVLAPTGIAGATITGVSKVDDKTYQVTVNTGTGDGSLGLNVVDDDSIANELGVKLGGKGRTNGNFTGQAFTIIKSPPVSTAINLVNPNPSAAPTVNYAVSFNQDVTGVDAADFLLTGAGVTGAAITSVTGSGKNYNVAVATGSNSGLLQLNLVDDDSIRNAVDTPLGGAGSGNGGFSGQTYTINKVPPRVSAINRLSTSPTNAAIANFAVIFNENVSRVDVGDFTLNSQGVTGARITEVTRVNGNFYTVAVNTGTGNGAIGLNLVDDDSIVSSLGLVLGGTGAGNANFTGEVYSIDKTAPTGDMLDVTPDPRQASVDSINIRFSEAVSGFDLSDLILTRDGDIMSLKRLNLSSADGINWTVGNLRRVVNRQGDYSLTINSAAGIKDTAGNVLTGIISDSWRNLVTVDVSNPGIVRRGDKGNDRIVGTEDRDTLRGLGGNDTLIGGDSRDRLVGGSGNDLLFGGEAQDTLIGEGGADKFVFSGSSQAEAMDTSGVDAPDILKGFNVAQGDRIVLDYDNNLRSQSKPRSLYNAGKVGGSTLQSATRSAYADKNQAQKGKQALAANEAVFFRWGARTYLAVNNGLTAFSTTGDLVVDVSGMKMKAGDEKAGMLNVNNYFG